MSDVKYNTREWLNSDDSHYSGSIVCFDGENVINLGKLVERYSFVEIADCQGKAKIHRDLNFGMDEFINKLRIIQSELTNYIDYLDETEATKQGILSDDSNAEFTYKNKTLPSVSIRSKSGSYEIHYLSPNKKERMTTIAVSVKDHGPEKAKIMTDILMEVGALLQDDPSLHLTTAPVGKITDNCENDHIMRRVRSLLKKLVK